VKLEEAPKLVHFWISPCIFFPLFSAHADFLTTPWVLAQLRVRTLSFDNFTDNFIITL
jgi:hypothetical protein